MMPSNPGSFLLRYGCAALTISVATVLRLLLDPALGNRSPFATFYFAVLLTASYVRFRPALVAVVLGAFCSTYFIIPPRGSFRIEARDQQVGMYLYLGTSLGIAILGGVMHTARQKAEDSAQVLGQQAALLDLNLVWTCGPDGWFEYLSPPWITYTGIAEPEQLGTGWLERVHPDDRPAVLREWQQAVKDETEYTIEFRIRRWDGVYRWFQTRARGHAAVCAGE